MGYSFWLTARVLLYAPSPRQDNTYHGLCYTSRGALAGTRNSSMGPPHEGSIRRPIAPWANALPLSYVPLLVSERQIPPAADRVTGHARGCARDRGVSETLKVCGHVNTVSQDPKRQGVPSLYSGTAEASEHRGGTSG